MEITVTKEFHFQPLNEAIRQSKDSEVVIDRCIGQRYIAAGAADKTITINGTPGNALGACLNGATIIVNGNAQDATGDTMNAGEIIIHGNAGDALGYAMRGGKIFVRGDAGYRVGIHMKAYKENKPIIVVGGKCGSFLGEYQAGGIIVVLGLGEKDDPRPIVGNFCGTGMHGGEIYLLTEKIPNLLPVQVKAQRVEKLTDPTILSLLKEFCKRFGVDEGILNRPYLHLVPDSDNPYKTMYTDN